MLEDPLRVLTPDIRNTSLLAAVASEGGPVPSLLGRKPHSMVAAPAAGCSIRGAGGSLRGSGSNSNS